MDFEGYSVRQVIPPCGIQLAPPPVRYTQAHWNLKTLIKYFDVWRETLGADTK